jgi:phosphatidyl-myo-inositol dimannoside synthase
VVVDWDDIDTSLQAGMFRKIATFFCESIGPLMAENITTHSFNIAGLALKRFDKKAEIVNQGVDFSIFDPVKCSGRDLKTARGLEDRFVLGYLCTLTNGGSKDIDIILVAFKEALKKDPKLFLMIIGGGPRESAIRSLVDSLGLGGDVLITGLVPQNHIPGYLAMSDLSLVYMRDDEGNRARVSFKVLESLAMNRPVVGHLVGETAERFGRYIDDVGRDIINFKKKILECSSGKIHGSEARGKLADEYSWEVIGDGFARLIGELSLSKD